MQNKDHQPLATGLTFVIIIVMIVVLLAGCATAVPVTARFPSAPGETYLQACPDLQKLKDQPQLSDVSRTININYSTYYECAVKLDTWIEWYSVQKKIFETSGK